MGHPPSRILLGGLDMERSSVEYRSYTTHRVRRRFAMAHLHLDSWIQYTWEILGTVWLIGLAFTKRNVSPGTGSGFSILLQRVVFVLGFFLVASDLFQRGWLGTAFLAETYAMQATGFFLTVLGCLFAIWARLALGANWSGTANVKQGHQLIVKGPYRLTRHPIYTGILVACVGTALGIGQWRCLAGLIVISLGLVLKMSQEERLMMATFPEGYPQYRRRVKALIPGIL